MRKMISTIVSPGKAETIARAICCTTRSVQSPSDVPHTRVHGNRLNAQLSQT